MNMARPDTATALNKLSKHDLLQLVLNTEANLRWQITKPATENKDLVAEAAIVRNVKS